MNKQLKLPVLDILDCGTHKEEHLQFSFVFHCNNQKFTVAGYFTLMLFARERITRGSTEIFVYLWVACCSTIFPCLPVLRPSILSMLSLTRPDSAASHSVRFSSPPNGLATRSDEGQGFLMPNRKQEQQIMKEWQDCSSPWFIHSWKH